MLAWQTGSHLHTSEAVSAFLDSLLPSLDVPAYHRYFPGRQHRCTGGCQEEQFTVIT